MDRRHRTSGELAFSAAGRPARPRWPCWSGSPGAAGGRGAHQDRQGPCRSGPAPGAPLALLVSPGHAGDAGPRLPGGGRPPPARPTPTPAERVPLTCNEVGHLYATLAARPATDVAPGCAGLPGDAATRPAPAPTTTADRQPGIRDKSRTTAGLLASDKPFHSRSLAPQGFRHGVVVTPFDEPLWRTGRGSDLRRA
jgi:hypothetical protein